MGLLGAIHTLPTVLALVAASATAQQFYGGLLVEITKKVECTRHSRVGDRLSVNYRGTLKSDGSEFDSSFNRKPFTFTLGAGEVIKGWDVGLVGMCIGEERNLTIPPTLAYGDRDMGKIPPESTLVFETALVAIEGVDPDETKPVDKDPQNTPGSGEEKGAQPAHGSQGGPQHDADDENGKCKLLGPFALLIQGALGLLALLSLVWKRYRETPQRPLKVWFFDVSKQVFGSVLLHLANLLMSMFSSGDFDITQASSGPPKGGFIQDDRFEKPNPCSFYLLNLAIDTTIGIPILVLLLRIFHYGFSLTPLAKPEGSLRSGNYGNPPKATWWLKQSLIYFLGLLGMKFCVFIIFQLLPWLGWVGDWALRWTEGKAWVQITFVMLIFPLIMNALQYYIIDGFIKDKVSPSDKHSDHDGEEEEEQQGLMGRRRGSEEDFEERGFITEENTLKEPNPTTLPAYDDDDDDADTRIGSSSSRGSTTKDLVA
ncbi:uncharacterized protein PV09_03596 [Verruconis gallopava]|uniref:peptidylprolyl isomerase n=1 Tax=Verruconis gallopava TaxID=253628 RepID=A0A0D2B351_9PEZI|nr:uncharacterized protein PV09_03596 [Verruconis gallopava]KIW05739.1 hypothetical protein PV09_03596 [Verruconis gallopava]